MNRIEAAAARTAGTLSPLEADASVTPVATPVLAVVAGAGLAGVAVGCAEGHCNIQAPAVELVGDATEMSVGDLLQARYNA